MFHRVLYRVPEPFSQVRKSSSVMLMGYTMILWMEETFFQKKINSYTVGVEEFFFSSAHRSLCISVTGIDPYHR